MCAVLLQHNRFPFIIQICTLFPTGFILRFFEVLMICFQTRLFMSITTWFYSFQSFHNRSWSPLKNTTIPTSYLSQRSKYFQPKTANDDPGRNFRCTKHLKVTAWEEKIHLCFKLGKQKFSDYFWDSCYCSLKKYRLYTLIAIWNMSITDIYHTYGFYAKTWNISTHIINTEPHLKLHAVWYQFNKNLC